MTDPTFETREALEAWVSDRRKVFRRLAFTHVMKKWGDLLLLLTLIATSPIWLLVWGIWAVAKALPDAFEESTEALYVAFIFEQTGGRKWSTLTPLLMPGRLLPHTPVGKQIARVRAAHAHLLKGQDDG